MIIIKKTKNQKPNNKTKQTKKPHPKLGEAEGIETIRHFKENMREFRLKIEAMASKECMPGLLLAVERDSNRVHRVWMEPHACM